jgi:SAM domain (Sterile alpha motif)/Glycine-zipper domain
MKAVKDFDVHEVCIFIMSIGLEAKVDVFRTNSIDGDMLVSLTAEDWQNDLGLTSLQTKKLLKQVASLSSEGGGGGGGGGGDGGDAQRLAALQEELQGLESENAALKANLKELTPAPRAATPEKPRAPAPAPPPPPPPQKQKNEHEVVKGAARGAARGAVGGAIVGAITGNPAQGAKAGAAAGAAMGGMGGLAARRQRRMLR